MTAPPPGGHLLAAMLAATHDLPASSDSPGATSGTVKGGEEAARPTFAAVYDAHFAFVWRSVRGLGVPTDAVDDVTQEIFLVIHRRLGDFEGRSSLRSWIYGIARNTVRTHRRTRGRHPDGVHTKTAEEPDPERLVDGRRSPEQAAVDAQAADLVLTLLDALDDDQREVFLLTEIEQLTAPEIATMLGENVNTISSRLRLARADFAAALARHRAATASRERAAARPGPTRTGAGR